MKEMRTTKGGTDCPTLLHYVARSLVRMDPALTSFIEELPNVEAAARGTCPPVLCIITVDSCSRPTVSFQEVIQSVQSVVSSYAKAEEEVRIMKKYPNPLPNDRFLQVMEVAYIHRERCRRPADSPKQPFVVQISERVSALERMASTVETDLYALYAYYGEPYGTPESPKPGDFFGVICSFSLSLQVGG